jgi:peroxiredoxin
MTIQPLNVGEPAPWFSAATGADSGKTVTFDELAGRFIILFFFGTAARSDVAEILVAFKRRSDLFDYKRALFLGISSDPDDFSRGRVHSGHPGELYLWDASGAAVRQYAVVRSDTTVAPASISPVAFVLNPTLQIVEIVPLVEPAVFIRQIESLLAGVLTNARDTHTAPVLIVSQVFDRAFCRQLVDLYDCSGGREIGSIESNGKIVERFDPKFRSRLDYYIQDEHVLKRTREQLERRLLPMVYRAFQFPATRIERYLVGCYDSTTGGYFRAHRDNTAPVVAHRRFALTINLNESYEGGDLTFPEYSPQPYHTPPGDAIVFSCSLLHEVTPVTRNRRYAFLSFLYDERSQQIRDINAKNTG